MNDLTNTLLPFIPEKYRPLVGALIVTSPLITRALYAVMNRGGIKGVISAIWLGTNTPKPSAPDATAAGSSSKAGRPLLLAAISVMSACVFLLGTGCASLDPSARAIVVRTEQSLTVANATFDSLVHIDNANRPFFRTNAPGFHAFAEWLRHPVTIPPLTNAAPRGVALVQSANTIKTAYKSQPSTQNHAALIRSLAAVEAATSQAQSWLVTINPTTNH
jgi:hypothetical protein